jgi:hypothetical protein
VCCTRTARSIIFDLRETDAVDLHRLEALDEINGLRDAVHDQTACGGVANENEQILNAYALYPGGAIGFIDERNVTFRPKERPYSSPARLHR